MSLFLRSVKYSLACALLLTAVAFASAQSVVTFGTVGVATDIKAGYYAKANIFRGAISNSGYAVSAFEGVSPTRILNASLASQSVVIGATVSHTKTGSGILDGNLDGDLAQLTLYPTDGDPFRNGTFFLQFFISNTQKLIGTNGIEFGQIQHTLTASEQAALNAELTNYINRGQTVDGVITLGVPIGVGTNYADDDFFMGLGGGAGTATKYFFDFVHLTTTLYQGSSFSYLSFRSNNATVTGGIALEGVADLTKISSYAPLGTFRVSFRTPATTTEIKGFDVSLATTAGSANGTFAASGVPAGTYDVAIKGAKNLRVVLRHVVVSGSPAALPNVRLPAGDADNNNAVDVLDFGTLVNAYGTDAAVMGSGYDPNVDFDFNGGVDVLDFGLLVNEYGSLGAP